MQRSSDAVQHAIGPGTGVSAGTAGLWPALIVVGLAGIGSWFWFGMTEPVGPPQNAATSSLAEVKEQDVAQALTTLSGAPEFLAKFQAGQNGCRQPLAWLTIAGSPDQNGGTVRIRSGNYFSPNFTLTAKPMRVAIPFPAAMEIGHGSLTVLTAGGGAVLALSPAWRVDGRGNGAVHEVVWKPSKDCPARNG